MAKQVQIQLVDDIDGGPADVTVRFTDLDEKWYEIDLSKANVIRFEEAIDEFVTAARRVRGKAPKQSSNGRRPAGVDREQNQAIREWARKRGLKVADRGRIPASVVEAFEQEA